MTDHPSRPPAVDPDPDPWVEYQGSYRIDPAIDPANLAARGAAERLTDTDLARALAAILVDIEYGDPNDPLNCRFDVGHAYVVRCSWRSSGSSRESAVAHWQFPVERRLVGGVEDASHRDAALDDLRP